MLVIFVSQDWHILGNKVELAPLLQQITSIWRQVLTREVHYSVISVAQRMSWAANRKTTRPEDEAYCLMGILGINMPTLYGEGQNAFQRLQEEIMKQSPDTTLFAWGSLWHGQDDALFRSRDPDEAHDHSDGSYLFARSPSAFHECSECFFEPWRAPILSSVGTTTLFLSPH